VRGAHVSISVKLDGCGDHSEIKLVQVLRQITKKDGKMIDREPDSPKRKERAGWSDPKAPSRGWQVDEVETGKSPFYVSDPLYGNDGSSTKAAKLRDTPGEWTTDKNVGAEFRTCAVSYAGGKGTVLACVDWAITWMTPARSRSIRRFRLRTPARSRRCSTQPSGGTRFPARPRRTSSNESRSRDGDAMQRMHERAEGSTGDEPSNHPDR
jgi:hypothetical protein